MSNLVPEASDPPGTDLVTAIAALVDHARVAAAGLPPDVAHAVRVLLDDLEDLPTRHPPPCDADTVRMLLGDAVEAVGGKKAWAARAGVSPQYVGDVLRGRRDPGDAILAGMGMERIVGYRDIVR